MSYNDREEKYRYIPHFEDISEEAWNRLNNAISGVYPEIDFFGPPPQIKFDEDGEEIQEENHSYSPLISLINLDDIAHNVFSKQALMTYLSICLKYSAERQALPIYRQEIRDIKSSYAGAVGEEFIEYMKELGRVGGQIGGTLRAIRAVIILVLSVYVVGDQETSKRSVIKMQYKLFGTSLKNDDLNNVFSNPDRKSGGRVKPLVIDEKRASEARDVKKYYWKYY